MVGASTFGTAGGYIMPGLLMGVLQIGWFAVGTFFSADYILRGMGMASKPGTLSFGIVCVLWGGAMAWAGAKGVQYVSRIALFLSPSSSFSSWAKALSINLTTSSSVKNCGRCLSNLGLESISIGLFLM